MSGQVFIGSLGGFPPQLLIFTRGWGIIGRACIIHAVLKGRQSFSPPGEERVAKPRHHECGGQSHN